MHLKKEKVELKNFNKKSSAQLTNQATDQGKMACVLVIVFNCSWHLPAFSDERDIPVQWQNYQIMV